MMALRPAGLLLALLLASPTHAADPTAGAQARSLEIAAKPVQVGSGSLQGALRPLGAWELTSADPDFGGLSGLLVEGALLTAVTDAGHWLTARLEMSGLSLAIRDARIAPMLDERGRPLEREDADAEGLTRVDGDLAVSFEREHRIARHVGSGQLAMMVDPAALGPLTYNAGLEALVTLADGRMLALPEAMAERAFQVLVLTPPDPATSEVEAAWSVSRDRMTAVSQHVNTGADITPDGRLLVVQRFYSQLRGPSARLLSYALLPTGVPDSASVRQLAGFESAGGIDNMEGLAVSQDAEGRMIVWLLSDDNFNTPQQRTLLLAFHLDD